MTPGTPVSGSRFPVPVSFEFYPPKTDEQREQLDRTVGKLRPHAPDYVSCTFGAGGSTLAYTSETVRHLRQAHALDAAPHISCVGGTREELRELLRLYKALGCRRIVALRGDLVRDLLDAQARLLRELLEESVGQHVAPARQRRGDGDVHPIGVEDDELRLEMARVVRRHVDRARGARGEIGRDEDVRDLHDRLSLDALTGIAPVRASLSRRSARRNGAPTGRYLAWMSSRSSRRFVTTSAGSSLPEAPPYPRNCVSSSRA